MTALQRAHVAIDIKQANGWSDRSRTRIRRVKVSCPSFERHSYERSVLLSTIPPVPSIWGNCVFALTWQSHRDSNSGLHLERVVMLPLIYGTISDWLLATSFIGTVHEITPRQDRILHSVTLPLRTSLFGLSWPTRSCRGIGASYLRQSEFDAGSVRSSCIRAPRGSRTPDHNVRTVVLCPLSY